MNIGVTKTPVGLISITEVDGAITRLDWGGASAGYGDIATALDSPAQAIGQACGSNPIPIIIPCHRVVGADNLGGYSGQGGVETKVALLRFEGAHSLLI